MKRILAIILCLAMMAMVPACKPDHIQPPAEIIHPDEQEQNEALGLIEEEEEEPAPQEEEAAPSEKEETEEEKPEEKPEEQEEQKKYLMS